MASTWVSEAVTRSFLVTKVGPKATKSKGRIPRQSPLLGGGKPGPPLEGSAPTGHVAKNKDKKDKGQKRPDWTRKVTKND